jgi:hypothetical protein
MCIKVIRVLHQNFAKNISNCQQIRQILDESQGVIILYPVLYLLGTM